MIRVIRFLPWIARFAALVSAGLLLVATGSMVRKSAGARGPVDLNAVVADVVTIVHSDAVGRNCMVVTELQPKLPLVKADRVQLQQVLMNIIVNAFDAMCHIPVPERRAIIRTESLVRNALPEVAT